MEEKKKSTLGKAFSRTFGRSKQSASAKASVPPPAAATPAAAPAPAPAPVPEPVAQSPPTKPADPAPAADPSNVVSPITIPASNMANVTPPESTAPSAAQSPVVQQQNLHAAGPSSSSGSVPGSAPQSPLSPRHNAFHSRDSTVLSNSSTRSHLGGLEDGAQEGSSAEGLNPTNILVGRLMALKTVLKNLQYYFAEVVDVEKEIGKSLHKTSNILVVPFKDGQQFLGKGGLQDVVVGLRDSTRLNSEYHTSASRFVEETIVKNIRRLKQDVKGKVKALKADTNLYSSRVFKEREATQERIAQLAKAIGLFEMGGQHHSDMEKMQSDPYVINLALKKQLAKQVHEENLFARAFRQCQENVATFEAHIIKELKQILGSFAEYYSANSTSFVTNWAQTDQALQALQEDSEWNFFLEKNGHQLFPSDLVDVNPDEIDYPCKDSAFVQPVKAAHLSRQTSVLKNWKEGYFVMTLAGWLHVFASADLSSNPTPEHSIFLPTSLLGPHSDQNQKQHVFSLEGKGKGGLLHRDTQTFTLRAHSREELLEWWQECSKRASSTLVNHPNEGGLSRSGSLFRSSSLLRPKSPEAHGPSPPYVAQAQNDQAHIGNGNGNGLQAAAAAHAAEKEKATVAPEAVAAPPAQPVVESAPVAAAVDTKTAAPVAEGATTEAVAAK
ncbi:hypothetical protein BGW42_002515 [Actinomortierella wolfii]|nr:hypothetical protein BGW42_002515 [Actinomortierella wolfii]